MTIRSEAELAGMRRAGAVVAAVLRTLERAVEPGITTGELDALCTHELARRDAEPTPARELRIPGSICISVNDEAVHGVPGGRRVERGDLVKLDLVATRGGFVADSALTVCVPQVSALGRGLVRAARSSLDTALANVRAGLPIRALGRVIERTVRRAGFQVIRELGRHGVTSGGGAHDGWTLRTRDRAPVAHGEHTLVVTRGRPVVVTA